MRLPDHEGVCACDHGYDFRLTVRIRTARGGKAGFPLDLLAVDAVVKEQVVAQLADRSLNDILAAPSLENIAYWIGLRLQAGLPGFDSLCLEAGDTYAIELDVKELTI